MVKKCTECELEKEESDFPWRNKKKGVKNSRCKQCQKNRSGEHYEANKKKYRERNKISRKTSREFMLTYLEDKECSECGISDKRVLEFDHLPQFEKTTTLCSMVSQGYSLEVIKEEIKKCRILCANCHRVHTCESRGNYRKLG